MKDLLIDELGARRSRYRSTANDRATVSERVIGVLGPVAGLDAERARKVLQVAGGATRASRISLVPHPGLRRWEYCAQDIERVVTERPDFETHDLGRFLTEIGNREGERHPLEVLICGDYVVVDYSHGIGDGRLGLMLLAALAGDGNELLCRSLAKGLPARAAWSAISRHYASNPARIRDTLRLRKANRARFDMRISESYGTRTIDDWKASTCCRIAYMEPAKVTELRDWALSGAAPVTTASLSVALWMAALRGEGTPIDPTVVILVNCRRYLGADHRDSHGNFAVGVPVPLSASPSGMATAVRQITESGWPAAILAYGDLAAWVDRRILPVQAGRVEVPDRVRLVVSDLGRLTTLDDLPWLRDQRPPVCTAHLEPDGADAITLFVSEVGGGRTYSASFCAEMIDPEVVENALKRMCTNPVGVLEAALP